MCYLERFLGMATLRDAKGFMGDETKWLVFLILDLGIVPDFATSRGEIQNL